MSSDKYKRPHIREDATDCNHFVNEMMKRTGFESSYLPTRDYECLRVFKAVSEVDARPGDLIRYPDRMGFLDASGQVLSATEGGKGKHSRLDPKDPAFLPNSTRLKEASSRAWHVESFRRSCP